MVGSSSRTAGGGLRVCVRACCEWEEAPTDGCALEEKQGPWRKREEMLEQEEGEGDCCYCQALPASEDDKTDCRAD